MPKSIKLKNDYYIDTRGIAHNKQDLASFINQSTACGSFGLNGSITLTKTYTYGGEDIPLNRIVFNYGDMFELKNNKVYCKKDAVILVATMIPTTLGDGYLLFGGVNGDYGGFCGSSNDSTLAGATYNNTAILQVKAGDYITLKLGKEATYSNITVYGDAKLYVSVIRLL